jgi:hypothetical protein
MIQGLFIDVPSTELKTMLESRLKYHTDKVTMYTQQLEGLEKLEAALGEEARRMGKTSTQSPKESMEQAIKKHADQIVYYKFMSEHVVPNEVYRLGDGELHRLGVQSERHY